VPSPVRPAMRLEELGATTLLCIDAVLSVTTLLEFLEGWRLGFDKSAVAKLSCAIVTAASRIRPGLV
jgi:hypothetical protein